MKQNILTAALLAGMLALAGCGGGSSSGGGNGEDDTTTTNNNDDTTTTTTSGPATLSGTGLTAGDPIRLEKDETHTTPNGGTITCPTAECIITVADQRGTPKVTATGGATFAPKPPVQAGSNNRQEVAEGGWLSDRNLLNAVKTSVGASGVQVDGITITDSRGADHVLVQVGDTHYDDGVANNAVGEGGTFNGTDAGITETSGSKIGHVTITAEGRQGDDTKLRLIHTRGRTVLAADNMVQDRDTTLSDYLVFGTWLTETGADSGPQSIENADVLVAGSLPWELESLPTSGDARYEGKVIGHYKRGSVGATDPWSEWDGLVHLEANFSRGTSAISGTINTKIVDGKNSDNTDVMLDISLDDFAIGNSGKISGAGLGGTWEATFYGAEIDGKPNGIAGSFAGERAARAGGELRTPQPGGETLVTQQAARPAMTIQGAFGAHHVGQLEDDEQQQ